MTKQDLKSSFILKVIEKLETDKHLESGIFLKLIEETDESTVLLILNHFKQVLIEAEKFFDAEKNSKEIAFIVHKLKSSSRLLGLVSFSNQCEVVENGIKLKNLSENLYQKYKLILSQLLKVLNEELT